MVFRFLKAMVIVGGLYDFGLALPLLLAPELTAQRFGAPPPVPVVNAQLNGLFTLTLALGYFWCAQDVSARRGYVWIVGVFAKLAGAALFALDHLLRGSPSSYLLFAVTDGSIGLLTLLALALSSRPSTRPA